MKAPPAVEYCIARGQVGCALVGGRKGHPEARPVLALVTHMSNHIRRGQRLGTVGIPGDRARSRRTN